MTITRNFLNSFYFNSLMKEYFLNHINSNASGKRSSVLSPIIWLLGLSMTSILSAASFGLPEYILIIFIIIFIIGFALFLFAYLFSFFKSPDHLRSESFIISKMQIEKGISGDQLLGQIQDEVIGSNKSIEGGENEY